MSKLLGHFLQEQQEPLERGCSRGINKSPNCSAFLKAVFGRNALKLKGSHEGRCCSLIDRKKKGRGDEDTKQLSPVSVLQSHQHSPIHRKQGESSNSISGCKLKKQRLKQVVGSITCDQYSVNMRALHQRKHLLIDFVREKLEMKKMEEEEAWKVACENVFIWSQDSINGSTLLHLLHSDFLALQDEWNADFEHHKMEISNDLENAIFQDVINEIVV